MTISISYNGFLRSLRRVQGLHASGVQRGLTKAALQLQRDSQAIVPVDIGNLKNSAFTRREGSGFKTVMTVGYTAAYAVFVHEILTNAHGAAYNAKHSAEIAAGLEHSRGPNQQAKFLEQPARQNFHTYSKIVRDEARIQ